MYDLWSQIMITVCAAWQVAARSAWQELVLLVQACSWCMSSSAVQYMSEVCVQQHSQLVGII